MRDVCGHAGLLRRSTAACFGYMTERGLIDLKCGPHCQDNFLTLQVCDCNPRSVLEFGGWCKTGQCTAWSPVFRLYQEPGVVYPSA